MFSCLLKTNRDRRTLVLRREENISFKVIYVQERRTLVLRDRGTLDVLLSP
jgi:hypothetical protein